MDNLFDIPETLSPYLQWEKDNRIKAEKVIDIWFACQSDYTVDEYIEKMGISGTGRGHTREEAVANIVKKNNIKPFGADQLEK